MKSIILCALIFYCANHLIDGAQIFTSNGLLQEEEFDCPTTVPLIENECNKCYCTSEGELACTINECPENRGKNLENCAEGTSWRKDCNKCWCITIGTVCTNLECKN
ncbi:hypothetical protein ILUMI_09322 [Ignelater luminosus]|uniref:Pacifastin domain-containing protein n=1 Tax=Ignelater luminosus TaxID=2038154 RepID=A0A8K0D594_IGNLU|nr:hypothetical protein ILUMI_09322 [Ignelater luminosus]